MPPNAGPKAPGRDDAELRDVVPARAVLTELARGFLLVRENDRARAVRFAATFLKEHTEPATRAAVPVPIPSAAQRAFGRGARGGVERFDPRVLR